MSYRDRATIHMNKVPEFKEFLVTLGYVMEETKGPYEIIRARLGVKPPVIFHKRDRTNHLTVWGREGQSLSARFMHRRRVG